MVVSAVKVVGAVPGWRAPTSPPPPLKAPRAVSVVPAVPRGPVVRARQWARPGMPVTAARAVSVVLVGPAPTTPAPRPLAWSADKAARQEPAAKAAPEAQPVAVLAASRVSAGKAVAVAWVVAVVPAGTARPQQIRQWPPKAAARAAPVALVVPPVLAVVDPPRVRRGWLGTAVRAVSAVTAGPAPTTSAPRRLGCRALRAVRQGLAVPVAVVARLVAVLAASRVSAGMAVTVASVVAVVTGGTARPQQIRRWPPTAAARVVPVALVVPPVLAVVDPPRVRRGWLGTAVRAVSAVTAGPAPTTPAPRAPASRAGRAARAGPAAKAAPEARPVAVLAASRVPAAPAAMAVSAVKVVGAVPGWRTPAAPPG